MHIMSIEYTCLLQVGFALSVFKKLIKVRLISDKNKEWHYENDH